MASDQRGKEMNSKQSKAVWDITYHISWYSNYGAQFAYEDTTPVVAPDEYTARRKLLKMTEEHDRAEKQTRTILHVIKRQ